MSTDINESQIGMLAFGDFHVDAAKRLLLNRDGESMPLMPKAFDTLLYLVERSGKIVSKDELMSAIWADRVVEENNLTQNISTLRRVLGERHGENRFIATVPGQGYKFVAEVRAHELVEKLAAAVVVVSPPEPLVPHRHHHRSHFRATKTADKNRPTLKIQRGVGSSRWH